MSAATTSPDSRIATPRPPMVSTVGAVPSTTPRMSVNQPLYMTHFGFREVPFGITPDIEFLLQSATHQNAINTILLSLNSGEGFVKVVGEIGTGKTLLCRYLLDELGRQNTHITAWLPHPGMNESELLRAICDEFLLRVPAQADNYLLLRLLNAALMRFTREGKTAVLLVDEAQAMPPSTLEFMRLLSNLESGKRKLLQIVLFGQPELDQRLNSEEFRQLRQRIAFSAHLSPLSFQEVKTYVRHRLYHAGCMNESLFDNTAMKYLFQGSNGTPRLINILANKALLMVYGEGKRQVRGEHVRAAVQDTEGASHVDFFRRLINQKVKGKK